MTFSFILLNSGFVNIWPEKDFILSRLSIVCTCTSASKIQLERVSNMDTKSELHELDIPEYKSTEFKEVKQPIEEVKRKSWVDYRKLEQPLWNLFWITVFLIGLILANYYFFDFQHHEYEKQQKCEDKYNSYHKYDCQFSNQTIENDAEYVNITYDVYLLNVFTNESYTYSARCVVLKKCNALQLGGERTCFLRQNRIYLKRNVDDVDEDCSKYTLPGIVVFSIYITVFFPCCALLGWLGAIAEVLRACGVKSCQ